MVEVQRIVAWEALPGAPDAVQGVIDLRGRVVPLLDLLERLGLPSPPPTVEDHLVIADTGSHVVALRVDEVLGIVPLPTADLEEAADVVPGAARVAGIARLADGLAVVADLPAFLGWEEADRLSRALRAALSEQREQDVEET